MPHLSFHFLRFFIYRVFFSTILTLLLNAISYFISFISLFITFYYFQSLISTPRPAWVDQPSSCPSAQSRHFFCFTRHQPTVLFSRLCADALSYSAKRSRFIDEPETLMTYGEVASDTNEKMTMRTAELCTQTMKAEC